MKTRLLFFVIAFLGMLTAATAQKVESFTISGKTYYGTKAIPNEITGFYQYEKNKEPIVEINKDGSGFFQFHGVPKTSVEYWIETDEKGTIYKRTSEINSNYIVVLIFKNNETGGYDRMDVAMAFDQGYAIVLGERYKKL